MNKQIFLIPHDACELVNDHITIVFTGIHESKVNRVFKVVLKNLAGKFYQGFSVFPDDLSGDLGVITQVVAQQI